MDYEILESRIVFKDNKIQKITVLVNCTSDHCNPYTDVRAFYVTTKPKMGYMSIAPDSKITEELLQEVAAGGSTDMDRDKIFPGWRAMLKNN